MKKVKKTELDNAIHQNLPISVLAITFPAFIVGTTYEPLHFLVTSSAVFLIASFGFLALFSMLKR